MKVGLPADCGLGPGILQIPELSPTDDGQPCLTDAQYEALEAGVARGSSVLVSAPTSTGKTLIGWWAIASTLIEGGRTVYLVSHRALAKQKFEEAQRLFLNAFLDGDRASIVCATGDGVEDASGRKTNAPMAARILVATYEKFLGCLSAGGPPRDLTGTTFVCDEIQLIGDAARGRNVELLLTLVRRAGWKQFVGLSAVLHAADAASLAEWLDIGLVRNPNREKALRLECRAPTAAHEVSVVPRQTAVSRTEARARERSTNKIVSELLGKAGSSPVIVFCMKVDDTYRLCGELVQGRRPTLKVVPPEGIEIGDALLNALARRAAFHNAELGDEERLLVESRLQAGVVDVVYATATLAAGVNFPLGSAVFAAWKRWNGDKRQHVPISRAEFHNMAGRVGRMGQQAAEGLVLLTSEDAPSTAHALKLMDFDAHDELGDGISPAEFNQLTLQIFAGKLCHDRQGAFDLLCSTLSAAREQNRNASGVSHWQRPLDQQIDRLVRLGCLVEGKSKIGVTTFGLAVARSGLKPETATYFIDGLVANAVTLVDMLPEQGAPGREDDLLFLLAHAALTSPEFNKEGGDETRSFAWKLSRSRLVTNDYARRMVSSLWEAAWVGDVPAANGALLVTHRSTGADRRILEDCVDGVRLGTIEALARDVGWILTGAAEIIAEVTLPSLADESKPEPLRGDGPQVAAARQLARAIRRMALRVVAGLPSDVLWMTGIELPGVRRRLSRTQVLGLRHHGLTKPMYLMDGGADADAKRRLALMPTEGSNLPNQVRDAARRWKVSERADLKRLHARRAARLGMGDVIENLYVSRGNDLEAAFEAAMLSIAIDPERLDHANKQAHPDFLVAIEDYAPIVLEVKSKQADTELVALNAATEVLAASELVAMGEAPCVTLCSPGVDPSVPGAIERCRRLTVVEAAGLAEAVLRVREGTLTREGLHNWLTTPGIASIEDLPHPP